MNIRLKSHGFNRAIGHTESGIFITKRDQQNVFHKHDGFGMSCVILAELNQMNIGSIFINHCGSIFKTQLMNFYNNGITHSWDHDVQMILPKQYFETKQEYSKEGVIIQSKL